METYNNEQVRSSLTAIVQFSLLMVKIRQRRSHGLVDVLPMEGIHKDAVNLINAAVCFEPSKLA